MERAGVDPGTLPFEMDTDTPFFKLLEMINDIKFAKEHEYGDYVANQMATSSSRLSIFGHFVNIRRKFMRAEHIVEKIVDREATPDALIDTYVDMAVYALLGVQLAYELKQRGGNS
jgi:hypothetical protein